MRLKTLKYLMWICVLSMIALPGFSWSQARISNALPLVDSLDPVMVQVTSSDEIIQMDYTVPRAKISLLDKQSTCPDGICTMSRVTAGNADLIPQEGVPILPVIPAVLIIPDGKIIDHISVSRSGEYTHEGKYFVAYGEKVVPVSSSQDVTPAVPDSMIYHSNNPFPEKTNEPVMVQKKCGVSIAYVNLYPVTYYPLSGKLVSYDKISLQVYLKTELSRSDSPLTIRPERVNPGLLGIENPDVLKSYSQIQAINTFGNLANNYQYVIITTRAIRDATTTPNLNDLINHRINFGLTTYIKIVEDIKAEYPGVDDQEKIRNFITYAYNNWNTKYVLIVGDPYLVPMRSLISYYVNPLANKTSPSDLYYQCLDGNYNNDNDADWGEYTDGPAGGEIDFLSEVYIGRASIDNADEMSNFVFKTLKYENDVLQYTGSNPDLDYLKRVLLVSEILAQGDRTAKLEMEMLRSGGGIPNNSKGVDICPDVTVNTLYEEDGVLWDIINRVNNGNYGIINHAGHASHQDLWKYSYPEIDAFSNTNPFFVYSQGCLIGNIMHPECIGEHLTTQTRSGAWGAVLNSNVGISLSPNSPDGPSEFFHRFFWHAYLYEGIVNVGAMNSYSHEKNISFLVGTYRHCCMETNLFADPFSFFYYPTSCRKNLKNLVITTNQEIRAQNGITAGTNVQISSPANAKFVSGREIHLLPGFTANSQSHFEAIIDPNLYNQNCE